MGRAERHSARPPLAVAEVELGDGVATPAAADARVFPPPHARALVLVRCGGVPVGVVNVALRDGRVRLEDVAAAVAADDEVRGRTAQERARRWLLQNQPEPPPPALSWSVVICTRDRAADLSRCLESLRPVDGIGGGEVIVVDNAPSDDSTRAVVSATPFRYVRTPRGGLNHARAVGADAASGDVLLYTDDDVVVDRGWVHALLRGFDTPRVGAVTGLTMPSEVVTPAQHLFHDSGGHVRGFDETTCDRNTLPPAAAGRLGNGANMAFRRSLVQELRPFDAELDGGTVTRSGGDTYAVYRVLAAGQAVRYTPGALVWHRDRRELAELREMLHGYSVGVFAVLTRALVEHGDGDAVGVGLSWLRHHHARQLVRRLLRRPGAPPLNLLAAEWLGVALGPAAYLRARRAERRRARERAA